MFCIFVPLYALLLLAVYYRNLDNATSFLHKIERTKDTENAHGKRTHRNDTSTTHSLAARAKLLYTL